MSAVDDLTPLGIKEEDLNLIRNDRIKFDCGPLVYRTIIDWGFNKPNDKSIKEHYDYLKIGEKNKDKFKGNLKKWVDRNELKFQRFSFADFDITALHEFLPILCHEKIAQTFSSEYADQMKDPNSVESLLKDIKDFRNDVSHEYAEAVKDSHIDQMKQTMGNCISAAGKLYCKDQTEIDGKVKVLDDEFNKVLLNTTHLYENRVKYIGKFIETEVPAILLERYSPHFYVPLPGNSTRKDTSDIFQCSNLSVTTENKLGKLTDNKNIFLCTEIYNKTDKKFVVINGGPGSGKTTLMRNMCQDILQTSVHGSSPRYNKIEKFKIPIYIECRNEQPTNIATFLRERLKNFLSPEDDIYEAFKIVKGLVFLIDGYDEVTNTCRKLVDSIEDFCRDYNASCIVSSRDDAGNNFVNKLQRKNLNSTEMLIEPISKTSAKLNFLWNYADKMDDSIDSNKLLYSFENLTAAAKEVFSSPILLALFISLFVHDPDSVSQMRNEQSAYEAVRTNFLREMARKLENVPNPKGKAENVAYVLSKFCLKLFGESKYFLEEKDYCKMLDECEKIRGMPADVDIPSLLSCILTPEHSFKFTLHTSYQFMHSTIQEFFAAKYVSENLIDLQGYRSSQSQSEDGLLPEIIQVLGLEESDIDIELKMRYGNIIKLLILETLANGEMSKYRNTFTLLLKKYFQPERYLKVAPDYHLDLILSSDSNADIISIVSDCISDYARYRLRYDKHIKPMTEVLQPMKNGIEIDFSSIEVTDTQQIIKLMTLLGDDSKINLNFYHSYNNYKPLDGEFYTQLKNSKCQVTEFSACISSEEHLSIVVRVHSGNKLLISTPSVSDFSFAALGEYKGKTLWLLVKYVENCPSTGSNPITERTVLYIGNIPADGKENLYKTIKYICPKSKQLTSLILENCLLADTDANELLKKLHGENFRTVEGRRTRVEEWFVMRSRMLHLILARSEEEKREEEEKSEEEKREKKMRNIFIFIQILDLLRSLLYF